MQEPTWPWLLFWASQWKYQIPTSFWQQPALLGVFCWPVGWLSLEFRESMSSSRNKLKKSGNLKWNLLNLESWSLGYRYGRIGNEKYGASFIASISDFSCWSLCLPRTRFTTCCVALTVSGEAVASGAGGPCFWAGLTGEVLDFAAGLALAAVGFCFSSVPPPPFGTWEVRANLFGLWGHKIMIWSWKLTWIKHQRKTETARRFLRLRLFGLHDVLGWFSYPLRVE